MAITVDKLKIQIQVKLPKVPNFLLLEGGGKFPVSDFTKKELRKIGKQWVDKLVAMGKD